MKRLFCFLVLCSIIFSCTRTSKVLLFIKDGSIQPVYMLTKEVGAMKQILEQAGMKVIVATVSGKVIKKDSVTVTPDIRLSEAKTEDYAGFIFPCMASDTIQPEAVTLVKKAVGEGKPIAAQLSSVLILAKAGVLNGKKFAFAEEKDINANMYPEFNGGIFSGEGVVRDGIIITSGVCPWMSKMTGHKDGTAELTRVLIGVIKTRIK